jgi:hypothetical protein
MFWTVVVVVLGTPFFCAGDIYMIVEYDTNGTLMQQISMDVTIHTVELHVTLLGCDYGYYNNNANAKSSQQQTLKCDECICKEFLDDREEAFIADIG